tara:strand:+ start:8730 stop:9167 length:438 start_codon:yes stop_codon:yes gene_type:complete
MTALHVPDPIETLAQRKTRLQQECLDYRSGIAYSRRVIRSNLGVESIAKSAVGIVGMRAQSALGRVTDLFDLKHLDTDKIRRALPVIISTYSLLSRRALLRPILRGAAVVGIAGTGLYWYSRRKAQQKKIEAQAEILRQSSFEND